MPARRRKPSLNGSAKRTLKVFASQGERTATIWLSNILHHGDFLTIAREELPIDTYQCALVFGDQVWWLEELYRLMRMNTFVVWAHGGTWRAIGHMAAEEHRGFSVL